MLQRAGLRDTLFIAMSNYYYEHKTAYLNALNETGDQGHNLTPFLKFGLKGIASQCRRLFSEIRLQVAKALYRNTMNDLFGRLMSPRKRAMSSRQLQILSLLLDEQQMTWKDLRVRLLPIYTLKNPFKALVRDLDYLIRLGAVSTRLLPKDEGLLLFSTNLDWPAQITETEFFRKMKHMPKSRILPFLSS